MAGIPLLAPSLAGWNDDFSISDDLVGRLYRASESSVREIAAGLSPSERASLAAFCYARAHLHGIGLTIAATCDLTTLVQKFGAAVGQVLFDQSRERVTAADPAPGGRRPNKVTLAAFTPRAIQLPEMADDEPVAEIAGDAVPVAADAAPVAADAPAEALVE